MDCISESNLHDDQYGKFTCISQELEKQLLEMTDEDLDLFSSNIDFSMRKFLNEMTTNVF